MSARIDDVTLWMRGATIYSSIPPRPLVLNRSASDSQGFNASWQGPRCPCHVRTGPEYLSRCRRHHEDSHIKDGVVLFRCTLADPQHMQLYSTAGGAISGRVTGPVLTRLRQRHTRWSSSKLNGSAAVCTEGHRMTDLLQAEVRPCDAASLGASYLANDLQCVADLDFRRRIPAVVDIAPP